MAWRSMAPLAVAGLLLAACGSSPTTDPDSVFPEDAGVTSGEFTDDAGNVMEFGPGTELPEGWPAVLPVAPGELLSVSLTQDGGALATWIIPDAQAQQILDEYLAALQANGFTEPVSSSLSVPDEGVFSYDTTGNGFDVTVSAVIADVDSELTVIATAQPADGA